MAVSRALRRLFHIRALEEEQGKLALESSLADLQRLEHARAQALEADCRGRQLVNFSIQKGDLSDRLAGIEEIRSAQSRSQSLLPMIAEGERDVAECREKFLLARVHRRQAEALINETEKLDAQDAERRTEQELSDWYLNRMHREEAN